MDINDMHVEGIRHLLTAVILKDVRDHQRGNESTRYGIEQHLGSPRMERFFVVIGRDQQQFCKRLMEIGDEPRQRAMRNLKGK